MQLDIFVERSGSVPVLSHRGGLCSSALCIYCGGVRGAVGEESGVPAAGANGEGVYSDIGQRSASEQTHIVI